MEQVTFPKLGINSSKNLHFIVSFRMLTCSVAYKHIHTKLPITAKLSVLSPEQFPLTYLFYMKYMYTGF